MPSTLATAHPAASFPLPRAPRLARSPAIAPARVAFRPARALGAALGLGALLAGRAATAQTMPPPATAALTAVDSVTLRDGTVLRGQVAVLRPGVAVTLVLPNGATREFAWAYIAATSGPGFASAPASTAVLPPMDLTRAEARASLVVASNVPEGEPLLAADSGTVPLVVESTGAMLDISSVTAPVDTTLCGTPCTLHVPAGQAVRFRTTYQLPQVAYYNSGRPQARALSSVHQVTVPAQGALRVRIRPPDPGQLIGGVLLGFGGLAALSFGSFMFAMVEMSAGPSGANTGDVVGVVTTMAVGAGMLIGGGAFIAHSQGGIESRELVPYAPPVALGAAPLPGGGVVTGAVRF